MFVCMRLGWFARADRASQAKNALDHLNGFHLQERYIVGPYSRCEKCRYAHPFPVLYHMPNRQDAAATKVDLGRREEELAQLKKQHNIRDDD